MIRDILKKDYQLVMEIYNWYILNTSVTLEVEPHTLASFTDRIEKIRKDYPYIVCEEDGKVLGYAYLDSYGERYGYRYTCDVAIYVGKECRRKGIGRALMEEILQRADKEGLRDVIAAITDVNSDSIAFHKKMGFEIEGVFPGIADKFDQRFGLVYAHRRIR